MIGRNHVIAGACSFGIIVAGTGFLYDWSASPDWVTDVVSRFPQLANFHDAVMTPIMDYLYCGFGWMSFYTIVALALFIFGTLLPDIDSKSSILGQVIHLSVKHRTWTHTIWAVALIAVLSWWLRPLVWVALGYTVHLFFDSLSKMGVCWFYPYPGYIEYESGARVKRGHWLKLYGTGSKAETALVVLVVALFAVTLYFTVMRGGIPLIAGPAA